MKYSFFFPFLITLLFRKTNSNSNHFLSSVLPQANLILNNVFDSPDSSLNGNEIIEELERKEAESYRGQLFSILRNFIESLNILEGIKDRCKNVINRYLFGHVDDNNSSYISYIISDYHIIKFLDDSSKNRNNLGTYENCMNKHYKMKTNYDRVFEKYNKYGYNLNKSTFSNYVVLVVERNNTNDTTDEDDILNLDFNIIINGYCFPQGYNLTDEYCEDKDYLQIINNTNKKLNNILNLNDTKLEIFSLRKNPIRGKEVSTKSEIFLKMLPLIYFIVQASFCIALQVTIEIKKCCKVCKESKLKKIKEIEKIKEENEDDEDEYDNGRISGAGKMVIANEEKENENKIIYEILQCFDIIENFKEFLTFSINSTKYNNDSGLNFIRGLMGLSMIFVTIGSTFVVLYNSPLKESSPGHVNEFFYGNYFLGVIVMIGIRYSPRVLLSCSGYLLAYKYICFLNKNTNKACWPLIKSCFKFILYQMHKYFLFIMLLVFERCSAYDLFVFYNRKESPAFKYLYKFKLSEPSLIRFILSFLLYGNISYNYEEQYRNGNNILHYLWLPFTELLFFLIGILLITLGFATKWRIDVIILILIPVIYIAKLIFFYLSSSFYENNELPLNKSYSTLYYVFFNYGRDMINPLFNIPYFLIGIYFGFINYTIQRGITRLNNTDNDKLFLTKEEKDEDEDNENDNSIGDKFIPDINEELKEKSNKNNNLKEEYCEEIKDMPFLISAIGFVRWHRKRTEKFLLILIITGVAIFFFFCYAILLFSISFSDDEEKERKMKEAFTNGFIDFLYRIDIELVIFFVLWLAFIAMIKMNDSAFEFFNNIFWIVLSRPYFSFILTLNTFLMFIFYHEETLNEINSISVLMFSFIGGGGTFIFMSLFYIFYELPLKRLIRMIDRLRYCSNDNDEEDNNDRNNNEEVGNDDLSSDKEEKIKNE